MENTITVTLKKKIGEVSFSTMAFYKFPEKTLAYLMEDLKKIIYDADEGNSGTMRITVEHVPHKESEEMDKHGN